MSTIYGYLKDMSGVSIYTLEQENWNCFKNSVSIFLDILILLTALLLSNTNSKMFFIFMVIPSFLGCFCTQIFAFLCWLITVSVWTPPPPSREQKSCIRRFTLYLLLTKLLHTPCQWIRGKDCSAYIQDFNKDINAIQIGLTSAYCVSWHYAGVGAL